MNTDTKITVVGMGLIGGSLFKAAEKAGFRVAGYDRDDTVRLEDTDVLLLALPQDAIAGWFRQYGGSLKAGAVAVDTCGVKIPVCNTIRELVPEGVTFVGGHPMAGREQSGYAYADAGLFRGASMILTPYSDTPAETVEKLQSFFGRLGFGRVIVTTPEHHDSMIAYTSQLSHVIAAAYTQEPLSGDASGYAAGSYANMTRIASMDPVVWEKLFSANRDNLAGVLDNFIARLQDFSSSLKNGDSASMQAFIEKGAACKARDGFRRKNAVIDGKNSFGRHLKLDVFGASHAPSIGMIMKNFPRGFTIDMEKLQSFMERRAPGRDDLSTKRREADVPVFLSGLKNGTTTGEKIEAHIYNSDMRPADYGAERTVPRPGHADFPQWVQNGRIPSGGGENSGRMTAPMCIAGGICLQWLATRGVNVSGRLVSAGGVSHGMEEEIRKAKNEGDSVGAVIEVHVDGLTPGLGGAMFAGVESALSAAMFGIPGVKGIEFGAGFEAAKMRGSRNNDPFAMKDGHAVTLGNNHGGILGGMTTGMPLVFRLAMKPTPSIFMKQNSVDLAKGVDAETTVKGRHDPCIAIRAIPVAEALAAFVIADMILSVESATPRICLTLTEKSLEDACKVLSDNRLFADMAELRVDCLESVDAAEIGAFPEKAGMPVILTVRRPADGGFWRKGEEERVALFAEILSCGKHPFAYVDFEEDFRHSALEELAGSRGTRIIRSLHDFNGPVKDIVARCQVLKGSSDDIPKIAFATAHCSDVAELFRETEDFTGFPHIICAMGTMGALSRILAVRTHSMLTFTSPAHRIEGMSAIGHFTPGHLVRTYGFRKLTVDTTLYAVTGWPLGHTASPELNNSAFFAEAKNSVMVPIPAETAGEAMECAEVLGVRGMAVTIPHKEGVIPYMVSLDETARAIGAVNTVVRTAAGWKGFNTDAAGFKAALLEFLEVESIGGRKVAIIGAGGAARAVAYAIWKMGGDACIFNKTLSKAEELASRYGFKYASLGEESLSLLKEYAHIVIQATSVGLNAKGPEDDPIPFYEFTGSESVYDLVYVPNVTPVLARAAAAGCRTCSGMSMLVEQAREQRRLYAVYYEETCR